MLVESAMRELALVCMVVALWAVPIAIFWILVSMGIVEGPSAQTMYLAAAIFFASLHIGHRIDNLGKRL